MSCTPHGCIRRCGRSAGLTCLPHRWCTASSSTENPPSHKCDSRRTFRCCDGFSDSDCCSFHGHPRCTSMRVHAYFSSLYRWHRQEWWVCSSKRAYICEDRALSWDLSANKLKPIARWWRGESSTEVLSKMFGIRTVLAVWSWFRRAINLPPKKAMSDPDWCSEGAWVRGSCQDWLCFPSHRGKIAEALGRTRLSWPCLGVALLVWGSLLHLTWLLIDIVLFLIHYCQDIPVRDQILMTNSAYQFHCFWLVIH